MVDMPPLSVQIICNTSIFKAPVSSRRRGKVLTRAAKILKRLNDPRER